MMTNVPTKLHSVVQTVFYHAEIAWWKRDEAEKIQAAENMYETCIE